MTAIRPITVIGILALAISCGFSQQVNFNNSNLLEPPDRTVYMPDMMTPIIGSPTTEPATFVVQLYYGTNADSLQPVATPPARFRTATMGPGLWLGGNRTLAGFHIGDIVTLQVRAWDAAGLGLAYDEVKMAGGLWGDSATFTYQIPPNVSIPDAYYIKGFQSFSLVPEPSTIALTVVGVLGVALWTRRKQ
jgi:hypothetical protein